MQLGILVDLGATAVLLIGKIAPLTFKGMMIFKGITCAVERKNIQILYLQLGILVDLGATAVLLIGKIAPLTFKGMMIFKGITCAVAGTVVGYITVTKAMGEFNAEKIKQSKVA